MDKIGDVLVVEDNNILMMTIVELLQKNNYTIREAKDGLMALQKVKEKHPDLILLDIHMPNLDGYQTCKILKENPDTSCIPIIFLSALDDVQDKVKAFEMGAVDYISKPYEPEEVIARVKTHVTMTHLTRDIEIERNTLEKRVAERTHEIDTLQDATIVALATIAETRDDSTGKHIIRTKLYVKSLAEKLISSFGYDISPETVMLMYKTAPLHDIGKVGIPDAILLKPGRHTPEEFEIMKTHADLGRRTLEAAEKLVDNPTSFLSMAKQIAYCHHEKWNGQGYPRGLKGEEIPLAARLMAIADVYDAVRSPRVYKRAWTHEEVTKLIVEGKGQHFDPIVVDAYLLLEEKFQEIASTYVDENNNHEIMAQASPSDA